MTLRWQVENAHAKRTLNEPCPFCGWTHCELWFDPAHDFQPYQVRCGACGACGPQCDCGEASAIPMWLKVVPLSDEEHAARCGVVLGNTRHKP